MADIQSIFKEYGTLYREKYGVTNNQAKVMKAIESCRTSALNAHVHTCNECGHEVISYNSCRNRHCPQCQDFKREQWLNKQEQSLLLTHYFHVVFTLPQELRSITLFNQEKIYNLLFKAACETLLELSSDPKHLGANIGFSAILHTWGQNLMFHPHIHCILPGGGLAMNNTRFIHTKKKFFIHVKVLGSVFGGKFLFYLNRIYANNELNFFGDIDYLQYPRNFQELIDFLYSIPWNVNSKPNLKKPSHVMKYLGNYTHRVAISIIVLLRLKMI
ncbi:IS91 family transposase [Alkaliphilus peptidifermentans]|uniref:Putative transposase n=1 Tax=Alkaliphilus peptidifermentans DSM 18978 TaxID=1120976 RepID=A0A1G5GSE8_9FIRM|nr:transposase zinc-binding domain-containing protein [Alkaliphilus peptidifermentans]SCY54307.1 Putative transposase [Alkaliphilus peptidifermentans DSM 18978]